MTTEPADRGYVAVKPHGGDYDYRLYRRLDDIADANQLGEHHWFSRLDPTERARTWAELTGMGLVAYVGEFVDRAGEA